MENGCVPGPKSAGHILFLFKVKARCNSMFRKFSENIKENKGAYLIKGV